MHVRACLSSPAERNWSVLGDMQSAVTYGEGMAQTSLPICQHAPPASNLVMKRGPGLRTSKGASRPQDRPPTHVRGAHQCTPHSSTPPMSGSAASVAGRAQWLGPAVHHHRPALPTDLAGVAAEIADVAVVVDGVVAQRVVGALQVARCALYV